MRPDEISMAESLSRHFGVGFLAGEDPPDIYLTFDGGNIAVEISTLAQLVDDGTGKLKPRLSDEMPAVRLTNELDSEMKNRIPDGRHFLLILGSPIRDPRKTKEATHQLLSEMLTLPVEDIIDREVTLSGNRIQVTLFTDGRRTKKKVVAAISNQRVGYDVYQVTKDMLEYRILDKAKSCAKPLAAGKVWLALKSDYFFAEVFNLQLVMSMTKIANPFDRILLIGGDGSVSSIHERTPAIARKALRLR